MNVPAFATVAKFIGFVSCRPHFISEANLANTCEKQPLLVSTFLLDEVSSNKIITEPTASSCQEYYFFFINIYWSRISPNKKYDAADCTSNAVPYCITLQHHNRTTKYVLEAS